MNKTISSLCYGTALALLLSVAVYAQKGKAVKPKGKTPTTKKPTTTPAETPSVTQNSEASPKVDFFKDYKLGTNIILDKPGQTAAVDDILEGHITVFEPSGKILQSSHSQGNAVTFKLQGSQFPGDLNDGLTKLSAGDSALVVIPTDDMMKGVPEEKRPPMFPKGSRVVFGIKIESVTNGAAFDQKQKEALLAYSAKKGLKPVTLPSGLMYVITKPGQGSNIKSGDKADVHYTGKLLNDTIFDSSLPRGETFNLTVGTGSVIKGWDEGLQQFNKGAKGLLLIPYNMAYGEQGSPPKIMPFAPLVFEIEVVNISSAGPPSPPKEDHGNHDNHDHSKTEKKDK
jgi:FKBP-type peptidyl-prolyl cis-trans isomerase